MLRRLARSAVLLYLLLSGCSGARTSATGGVAVSLTREPLNGQAIQHADLSRTALQAEALIRQGDILAYHLSTHEIELRPEAVARLAALKLPMDGLGFVLTVDGKPVYGGAFWTALSSLSYEGVTILQPLDPGQASVRIATGYPTGDAPGADAPLADDPRADPRVLDALRRAGVLKE